MTEPTEPAFAIIGAAVRVLSDAGFRLQRFDSGVLAAYKGGHAYSFSPHREPGEVVTRYSCEAMGWAIFMEQGNG